MCAHFRRWTGAPADPRGFGRGSVAHVRRLAALAISNHLSGAAGLADAARMLFHASVLVRHPPSRARLTATVHDLTGFLMPELHPRANLVAEGSFAQLARRADGLIAVSECTRQDAIRALGIAPEKICTIHSGVADSFFDPPAALVNEVRIRYRLQRPFVLFVGTIEPRKNIDLLLDAFESLPASLREHFELVVAGPVGWAGEPTLARLKSVRYLGYVPELDLAPLTAAARDSSTRRCTKALDFRWYRPWRRAWR